MKASLCFVPIAVTIGAQCASAQGTVNAPFINEYFVTPPAGGSPGPLTPCPSPVITLSVAASPFTFNVVSSGCPVPTSAGAPVFGLVNLGAPCVPGFICLPPIGGCYALIPPVLSCLATNQSIDLTPGSFVLFSGVMTPGSTFASLPIGLLPSFVGVSGSTQAFFLDFSVGFVTTEAWDFLIVP